MKFSTSQTVFLLVLTLIAIIALCMVGFVGYQIFFQPLEFKEIAFPQLPIGWDAISAVIGLFTIILTAFIKWPKIRARLGKASSQKQPRPVFQENAESINLITPLTDNVNINSIPFNTYLLDLWAQLAALSQCI